MYVLLHLVQALRIKRHKCWKNTGPQVLYKIQVLSETLFEWGIATMVYIDVKDQTTQVLNW